MPYQYRRRKVQRRAPPWQGSSFCKIKGHSGYQKKKRHCQDCGSSSFCRIKGHSEYQKTKRECRDCRRFALCWTKGHSGYEKAKTECRDFSLCRTAGHSGYHNHKKYCQDCHQSTIKNRQKEKLTMEKNHGRSGSFWTKGGSADTIVLTECVCVIL